MKELRLPRLLSNGMVLQQKKKIHIWGWAKPGRKVRVSFLKEDYTAVAGEDELWETYLTECEPGGPHTMYVSDDAGNEITVTDILIGDVFICAGQSNMELPMERVKDCYPQEIEECDNSAIRTFKITENGEFHGPLSELLTGEWKSAQQDTILQFSATAYFFGAWLHQMTGIPVGLINASLGGSRIESWMSREMLEGYTEALETADKYCDERFVEEVLLRNQRQMTQWHENLDGLDKGLKERWERDEISFSDWEEVSVPFFFRDTKLKNFIGSVWFKRKFYVTEDMADKEAKLWLGTIVDSDTVYVNGVLTGHTDYQYPPRKYQIPKGLLHQGENTITVRVKCENGHGRFTPYKRYAIWNEKEEVDLSGQWNYRIGAVCGQIKPTDFVNWKPTALYNGMLAPCCNYTIAGFLWYQGESNTHVPWDYLDLTKRLIEGYRRSWKDESLPFLYVQLPNFAIDIYDSDGDETGQGWPVVRELQRQALEVPGTGMAVAIDLGEDNDLHPLNKKEIGRRLALLAADKLYGMKSECEGPQIENIVTAGGDGTYQITLYCRNAAGGLYACEKDKGSAIRDFEFRDENGNWIFADAEIKERRVILSSKELKGKPRAVRYCYANTNKGALIYNYSGFPMSPFSVEI